MKFHNRFIRLATAVGIVGIVATQVPTRSSVALAADGYPDTRPGFSLKGGGGVVLGGILVAAGAGAFGQAAGAAVGGAAGVVKGAGIGAAPIYDVVNNHPDEFDALAKIIRNGEQVQDYRNPGQYTLFAPTTTSLVKALGADRVNALQQTANEDQAKKFLASITVKGSYNIDALRDAARTGKILESLTGQSIVLKLEGDKLFANGVELVGSENPATNGWVIASNGIVATDES